MPGPIADLTDRQHDRHLHQYTHYGRQCRSGFGTEQRNECVDKARRYLPEHHTLDHTEHDPDYQIMLEGIQLLLDYWWRTHERRLDRASRINYQELLIN